MGPWSSDEISRARGTSFFQVLDFLGAYYKRDRDYVAHDPSKGSVRIQVQLDGRDFRFVLTGEKWVNELLPRDHQFRGGGGAIDFVRHVCGCGFVQAVKLCLDAQQTIQRGANG